MKLSFKSQCLIYLFATYFFCGNAFSQGGCAKDDLGRVVCAPAGGTAIESMNGIVCAPGRCVADNLGYLKCSSQLSGGASIDNLGRPVCVGSCVNPSKEYCEIGGKK